MRPPGKLRKFGASEKLRIVREANECKEPRAVAALLRREGMCSSYLASWRRAIETHGIEGMSSRHSGRKSLRNAKDRHIAELEKKLERADRELYIAQQLLGLQKKLSELLGVTLPNSEGR